MVAPLCAVIEWYHREGALTRQCMQFNPFLVLLFALLAWSAFDYAARLMSHKRAIRIYKDSQEYKIALKRFKEEKVLTSTSLQDLRMLRFAKRCLLEQRYSTTAAPC